MVESKIKLEVFLQWTKLL